MTADCKTQFKFSDHRNFKWVTENCETIASSTELDTLYSKLVTTKEICIQIPHTIHLKGPNIPDFEVDTPTVEEQEHLIDALIGSQSTLAEIVVKSSPFAQNLQKRLAVLQRIYHATSKTCHANSTIAVDLNLAGESKSTGLSQNDDKPQSGNTALVELGVQTGLGLLFSLLRQNWQLSSIVGASSLCNDVLTTALDIVVALPPLSLANESKLTSLGIKSLNQTACFLKSVFSSASGADKQGRQLSSELMLSLASQRGSLKCLLEWVELAMITLPRSGSNREEGGVSENTITWQLFKNVVTQMMKSAGFPDLKLSSDHCPSTDEEGNVPSYQAAVCLLEQLYCLAEDFSLSNLHIPLTRSSEQYVPVTTNTSYTSLISNSSTSTSSSILDTCDVYIWGSNSTHQLAEGSQEKILTPKLSASFRDCPHVEAGQFCTFLITKEGSVNGCGKGSYGRLGLGDSSNQSVPKKLTFPKDRSMKAVSSSKGSDGHTLALSRNGEVYSWGDGDYGKLGHGNNSTQKFPKLITGLSGIIVVQVSAGFRHSAAVTHEGELYTWGEGDYGRLGHGDSSSKNLPTRVKDLPLVSQVSCGSSHTVVVARDGKTVWSFGSGDSGKLGHGDTCRQYKPKVIESLAGVTIRKVACGCHFSLALTTTGQLYAWGCGSVIGCGSPDATALKPRLLEDFQSIRLVDVVCGDNHCLALTHDNLVYAWGNNAMGQCGQGHSQSPITRPKKVTGAIGKAPIHQISAGTSHSIAWTAIPSDRPLMSLQRPFCVDIQEETFYILRQFLERYCHSFNAELAPMPFQNHSEHQYFVLLCLKVLCIHLSLAQNAGASKNLLGEQAKPLRNLLFKLIDMKTPDSIQQLVCECLSVGAQMLLPSLGDRMELLHSLLPQSPHCWSVLSRGQRMQLNMILSSLQNNSHISVLLGLSHVHVPTVRFTPDLHTAEILMKNILRNLAFETESALNDLEKNNDKDVTCDIKETCCPQLHELLSSIHKHLFAYCTQTDPISTTYVDVMGLVQNHLGLMIPLCSELISQAAKLLSEQRKVNVQEHVIGILFASPAGSMLFHMLHSLVLVPQCRVVPLLNSLLTLLSNLDQICKLLTNIDRFEKRELEQCFNSSVSAIWLVDLERVCSLLIGHCLGDMLLGSPMTTEEKQIDSWLENKLFSNGLQQNENKFETDIEQLVAQIMAHPNEASLVYENVCKEYCDGDKAVLLKLCCGVQTDTVMHALRFMQETA